jgi:uncharacterized protein (TIGR02246 family)
MYDRHLFLAPPPMEDDMQARMFFPASIALAVLVAGCAPATPPAAPDTRDADAKAIRQLEADWSQSFATKDLGKVTAFYADDASLFNTGMPVVTGKANIANIWKQYLADKNFSLTFAPDKVVVSKSGDMGSTQGSYTLTYTDPKTKKAVMEKGKYVEVYMKQADGSWKNTADISNTDEPVAPVKK